VLPMALTVVMFSPPTAATGSGVGETTDDRHPCGEGL
jgi:hypothetical protein